MRVRDPKWGLIMLHTYCPFSILSVPYTAVGLHELLYVSMGLLCPYHELLEITVSLQSHSQQQQPWISVKVSDHVSPILVYLVDLKTIL